VPIIDYIKTSFPLYDTSDIASQCELYNDNGWKAWKHPMTTSLDSFEMKRTGAKVGDAITYFSLKNLSGSEHTDLIGQVAKLTIVTFSAGFDYIVFNSQENTITLTAGDYYIEVGDGTNTWRTVRFRVSADASSYLTFLWYNTYDLGDVFFNSKTAPESEAQIKFTIRIDTNIDLPENEIEEEGDYRGTLFITTYSVLKEIYSIELRALSYVIAAFTRAQQYDNLVVTLPNGESFTVYDLTIDPVKETDGIAITKIGFRINSVEKILCDTNMTKS